jgi:hypothetical protein
LQEQIERFPSLAQFRANAERLKLILPSVKRIGKSLNSAKFVSLLGLAVQRRRSNLTFLGFIEKSR